MNGWRTGPTILRAVMAQALLETLEGVDVVVAYDKAAQKKCLEAIAIAVPEQAQEIMAISSKTLDLLPVVRDHVYHPDFLGSFQPDGRASSPGAGLWL